MTSFWVQEWVFAFDTTTWGGVHLVIGFLVYVWLPWYPLGAILLVAISMAVIWALTAHGREVEEVWSRRR